MLEDVAQDAEEPAARGRRASALGLRAGARHERLELLAIAVRMAREELGEGGLALGQEPLAPVLDPLQAGQTTLTGSAPNFIMLPGGGITVDVTSALTGSSTKTKGKPPKKGGGN